ncbi:serine/arginine repetitive matrix protein 2-like [Cervus canadensis]|uniref:serine/arginine repetitive matrix protein 2-like n=1 Tax=Cervus canadensis TaxID=1574408 RepID=UPI001C9E5F7B|nr:serine/arginine repetitive matrix protein 2-like [Cervus canadensis]
MHFNSFYEPFKAIEGPTRPPRGCPSPAAPSPPPGQGVPRKGRERAPRLSLRLGRGARKKEPASSAALSPHSSSEVGTHRAQRRTVPGRGASLRLQSPTGSEAKERRPWGRRGRRPAGGDRRRRVTMTTRGAARRRLRLQESLTWGLPVEPGETTEENAAGRPDDGAPKRRVPGWRGSARAAVWARRRSCLLPSARQSISPSVRPSSRLPLPKPATARLSLSHTAVVKRRRSQAPAPSHSQSARFPEAPQDPAERGGQAGACAEGRVGWAGPNPGRGGDRPGGPAPC